MTTQQQRVYGGLDADQRVAERRRRFIEAGLDLLGGEGDAEPAVSVRGVCKHAGLVARYFYESFADRDAFVGAVYDHVVDDLAATTHDAVTTTAGDQRVKTRAGIANLVRIIADDPRRGRLLFSPRLSSTLLAQRRMQSSWRFASLLWAQAREFNAGRDSENLRLPAHFMVGGLGQALSAWQSGELTLDREQLVDACTDLFVSALRQASPR
ncbi:TetR/AcrR family transcriptional regulator [Rhodococcus daqingensis]|uniref:TetR/AcrR family transcriptional regulator n=1 Tax=Rhodococcus daqingensis TaxID=2479363 RepID=A0ABW2RXT7_9NOCA